MNLLTAINAYVSICLNKKTTETNLNKIIAAYLFVPTETWAGKIPIDPIQTFFTIDSSDFTKKELLSWQIKYVQYHTFIHQNINTLRSQTIFIV